MDGFQKFDLQSDEEKNNVAIEKEKESFGDMRKKSLLKGLLKRKKTFAIIGGVIGVLVLFIIFGIIIPAISVTKSAKATYAQSKIVLDAVKKQNVEVASAELDKTKVSLLQTQKDLQKMGYLAFVPIANFYYSDADHLVKAGVYGLDGGRVLIDSVAPYADVLGLKGKGSFVGGSAQQRIQTAVTTLSKITPNIDKISVSLEAVKKELDMVNSNHYPPFFGG